MRTAALLLTLCLSVPSLFAQPHNHLAPPTISGAEHPEQIADQRAWLMQLIASASSDTDSDVVKKHALIHRHILGLDESSAVLTDFRTHYDRLLLDYNNSISAGPTSGTTHFEQAAQRQLFNDIGQLVDDTVANLHHDLSATQWKAANAVMQASKAKMLFTAEPPPDANLVPAVYHPGNAHLVRAQIDFNGYAQSGYTQYTALETDGTTWWQTVYLYGTSSIPWTCVWDQYHGQWQPPGCPARHDFYMTNQINGTGPVNVYVGPQLSPTQYVSFSYGWSSAVLNNGNEDSFSGASIICNVAKLFFIAYVHYTIKPANELVAWDGTGKVGLCNVYPTCTNPRPWAIDGTWLIDLPFWQQYGRCTPGYNCRSFCLRSPFSGVWTCPSDLTGAYCTELGTRTYGTCTPHP